MSTYNKVVKNLSFAQYKSEPAVNASFLKKFAVSPLYASTDEFSSSAATDLGSFVHALTIDPSTLENFACLPTTGEGSKKARDEWRKAHPEGVLLSPSAMEQGKATAEALKRNGDFAHLMSREPDTEVSIFAQHPRYGWDMKGRVDILLDDGKTMILGDVKTYGKPLTKKSLFWDIRDRGYDIQLAFYRRIIQTVLNRTPDEMALYFVETETSAHDSVKVTLDEGWMAHAEMRLDEYFRIYDECHGTGIYPGFNFGKPLHLTLGDNLS